MDNPYYTDPNQKSKLSRRTPAIIVVIVVVAILCLLVWFFASIVGGIAKSGSGVGTATAYTPPASGKYISKVSICGTISDANDIYSSSDSSYHHQWTINTIDKLINDDNNVALYLYIDSPGGSVYESDELYEKIMQYKTETDRPVYVYMAHMAASGGYYIAAPADHIFANRNATTGSIGVIIGTIYDVSGFLSEHGIKAEDITSGRNKGMGSYYTPLTDEQRSIYQSLVDESYERFVSIVADGRSMSIDEVKVIADGRIYTANQAKANGLIDEVAKAPDAKKAIEARHPGASISNAVYPAQYSFWNNIFAKASDHLPETKDPTGEQGDLASVLKLAETGELKPQLYYLYKG